MQSLWKLTIDMASSLRAVRKLVVELVFTHTGIRRTHRYSSVSRKNRCIVGGGTV